MKEETKKLNEEVLNEQPQAPVAAPVQADPAEVQAAQQNVAPTQPVDQPLVDETQAVPEQPMEEQPETVSIEMQIPTDQLAAAVAQATGDMEAAETAPDIEAEKQSEIAAVEAPEVPVEPAPTEAPAEAPMMESLTDEEKDVIQEYRKYKASKIKEAEEVATGDAAQEVVAEDEKEDMATGAPNVDEAEPAPIKESFEDEEPEGEIAEGDEVAEDPIENPGDTDAIEDEGDFDLEGAFDDESEDLSDYEEVEIKDDELVDQLHSIFADDDEVEDTAEALRTSADFLDSILAMDDDEEEEEEEVAEDDEDSSEEEDTFEEEDFDDEEASEDEESGDEELEVEDVLEESRLHELTGKHRAKNRYDDAVYTNAAIAARKGKINPEDLTGEVLNWVDDIVANGAVLSDNEKYALEMLRKKYNNQKAIDQLDDADVASAAQQALDNKVYGDERLQGLYRKNAKKLATALGEKKQVSDKKLDEAIVYPAGSRPINSAISNSEYDDNLVRAYEKSAAQRRKALANFRETMKKSSAATANRAKFGEALSGSSKMKEAKVDPKSWRANRFEDRMEERDQLDYKALLRNGFLG